MLPNKSTLILLGIGAVAGYFVSDSLILKDFNGSKTEGQGFNPFYKAYGGAYNRAYGSEVFSNSF